MPDIYCSTYYIPGREEVSDRLIDMSGYAFTDNYAEARLREVTNDGAGNTAIATGSSQSFTAS